MLKECDLVMKGGVTSGVIYPRLIARLARTYKLRNIGGSSAGAIAAAAAAAAQLGVHTGSNRRAFEELDALPQLLGSRAKGPKDSVLLNLFQPHRRLRRHFLLLIGMLNAPSPLRMAWRACRGNVRRFPFGAVAGSLPGLLLLSQTAGLASVISLCVFLTGLLFGAVVEGLLSLGRALPGNYFGLCNGMSADDTALTPWLTQYFNRLVGKMSTEPLTFGELWAGKIRRPGEAAPAAPSDGPVIQLAMMTTAVNLGRPFRLPFESSDLYFVEEELAQFFPKPVNDWLVAHARPSATANKLRTPARTFLSLPRPEDLPIIFAVRLSLSFPILLSALPLYAVDRTLGRNKPKPTHATRIYFSDGGICSNFPVHFFDSPLPLRPTFGVNLRGFHPDHPGERVWLPEPLHSKQGLKNHYPSLPDAPGLRSVAVFLASIVTTMQDWRDQLQLAMPGFRDRIVHVCHGDGEGGLNLNMEPDIIQTLSDSGAKAAEELIHAFANGGWDNHQRIRVRTALSVLQQLLDQIATSLSSQQDPSYDQIVLDPRPPSYKFEALEDAASALRLLHELRRLANSLHADDVDLTAAAPRPGPEIRITPRV